MDAVIAQYKPRLRTAAPSRSSWAARTTAQAGPSDHRWHMTTPEQLATASSRIVLVSPQDAWWVLGATVASLARHGHPVLVIEVDTQTTSASAPASAFAATATATAADLGRQNAARQPAGVAHHTLRFHLPADALARHEKALAEWLPLGSGDTVFVPWRHDGPAGHEACARATLAACRTVNARCIEYPVSALDPSHASHARLRRSVLQCVRLPQAADASVACEWTMA